MAVNGNYAANGQSYGVGEQNYEAHSMNRSMSAQHNDYNAPTTASSTSGAAQDISKEEVGWYFVEQYYTTLSKSPDKLFLFYQKQSQFVTGIEAEKAPVCVGQKAISDKIKELDIQDCKVRVTNVDSQGSRTNIVIQVIGEISNKSQPQRKFCQTFVLAEQTNGYFVLNDIFRYIADEDEYEQEGEQVQQPTRTEESAGGYQEPVPTAEDVPAQGLTSSDDPAARKHDAEIVNRSLEQAVQTQPEVTEEAPPNAVNGDAAPADVVAAEDTTAAAANSTEEPVSTAEVAEVVAPVEDPELEPEKPQDPEPTPAVSPPKAAAQPAPAPVKPAVPKTWANLVAGGQQRAAPVVPTAPAAAPAPRASPAPAQVQQAPVPVAPAAQVQNTSQQTSDVATPTSSGSEWQTAGHEHKRQQSRQAQQQTPVDNQRGFIKSVPDTVEPQALRDAIAKYANITYFDISRDRHCAFVDFASPAELKNAINNSPYEASGTSMYLEERRTRPPGNFPPRGRGNMRGAPGMQRGGRGGRGGFRGRGGAPQPA